MNMRPDLILRGSKETSLNELYLDGEDKALSCVENFGSFRRLWKFVKTCIDFTKNFDVKINSNN